MVARIASGRQVIPRLTRGVRADGELPAAENVPPPQFAPLDLPAEHLRIVREGMDAVSNDPRGTAYRARIKEEGFELAGKTGTYQVRRITRSEEHTSELQSLMRPSYAVFGVKKEIITLRPILVKINHQ